MKKVRSIFKDGDHEWSVIARDPERASFIIDTNEYLVHKNGHLLITDPGGLEIFPVVYAALCESHDPGGLEKIFSSHQDPDIISSLGLWLEVNPGMKCYLSRLWTSFVPHFGGNDSTFISLPDGGLEFELSDLKLQAFPAHYLHSSGNFHMYDEKARILFSGDVGAALLPGGVHDVFVNDFDKHIEYAREFHRRWMPSQEAARDWCERVSSLKIDMLCPQHGSIYAGANVERFINWFSELEVGLAALSVEASGMQGLPTQ